MDISNVSILIFDPGASSGGLNGDLAGATGGPGKPAKPLPTRVALPWDSFNRDKFDINFFNCRKNVFRYQIVTIEKVGFVENVNQMEKRIIYEKFYDT